MSNSAYTTISPRDGFLFVAIGFGIASLTRIFVFPLSVIDWDESIYLLVSSDLLHGLLPYQGTFDHKPVALYYLFALAQLFFGQSIHSIRILGILVVGGSAALISVFLRKTTSSDTLTCTTAGGIYALLSTLNGGLATNTEILINFYFILALLLINTGSIVERFSPERAAGIGIVLALMFQTNYLSALLIIGLCIQYLMLVRACHYPGPWLGVYIGNGIASFAAFVGFTVILLAPIALWSDLVGDYFNRQISFLGHYGVDRGLRGMLDAIHALAPFRALVFLSATIFIFLVLDKIRRRTSFIHNRIVTAQMLVYLGAAFLAFVLSGHYYPHYLILLFPPLSIILGLFLTWTPSENGLRGFIATWLILLFLAVTLSNEEPYVIRGVKGYAAMMSGQAPDMPSEIARYIERRLHFGETIYVYDYQPILYYLLHIPSPTHYPMPSHHLSPRIAEGLGIRPVNEIKRIMSSLPQFVIAGSPPSNGKYGDASLLLGQILQRCYRLLDTPKTPDGASWKVLVYEKLQSELCSPLVTQTRDIIRMENHY